MTNNYLGITKSNQGVDSNLKGSDIAAYGWMRGATTQQLHLNSTAKSWGWEIEKFYEDGDGRIDNISNFSILHLLTESDMADRQGYFMVARNKLRAYALQKNYFGFAYYGPSYRESSSDHDIPIDPQYDNGLKVVFFVRKARDDQTNLPSLNASPWNVENIRVNYRHLHRLGWGHENITSGDGLNWIHEYWNDTHPTTESRCIDSSSSLDDPDWKPYEAGKFGTSDRRSCSGGSAKEAGRDTTGMCAPTEEEWRIDGGLYNLKSKQNYLSQNLGKWLNDRSVGEDIRNKRFNGEVIK